MFQIRMECKGLMAGCIGLLVGCVGLDSGYTIPRLTFGVLKLSSGIDLVVLLIGFLAVSEVLKHQRCPRYRPPAA